jgi:hypothetical protein
MKPQVILGMSLGIFVANFVFYALVGDWKKGLVVSLLASVIFGFLMVIFRRNI